MPELDQNQVFSAIPKWHPAIGERVSIAGSRGDMCRTGIFSRGTEYGKTILLLVQHNNIM